MGNVTKPPKYLVCDCEKTMALDSSLLAAATGEDGMPVHTHLCRSGIAEYEAALTTGEPVIVACTQEAPLFSEIADEADFKEDLRFVNIRENAGWCGKKNDANPKIAALLKAATFEPNPAPLKSIESDGLCLVYGSGQVAIDMAQFLCEKLSVTLILKNQETLQLPKVLDVPIFAGTIRSASGSFGNFSLMLDSYAALLPSSRSSLEFAMARDGVRTQCSLIFDVSGDAPLFTGHEKRDGYFRVDPKDPGSLYRQAYLASEMVGAFEKPIYVGYTPSLCAHSRSQITGCSKCLDLCPAGAIEEDGDGVAFDDGICGGCGACHSACPTGAVSYLYPQRADLIKKAQVLIDTYLEAGGQSPRLLVHDEPYGGDMIHAIARHGDGLPTDLMPLAVHSTAMVGHVELGALIASGARQIILLLDPKKQAEYSGLEEEVALIDAVLGEFQPDCPSRIALVEDLDPAIVETRLKPQNDLHELVKSPFEPVGSKRDVSRSTFTALKSATGSAAELVALPESAPYGQIHIDQDACTLCMACVSACPADAMMDTPGEPRLRFVESACVQCGLCVRTCPEKALSREARLNLSPAAMQPITLKEEEPFCCSVCGEAFATRSTINRIQEQLAGKHAMFQDDAMANLLTMCDTCRIESQANSGDDPFAMGTRPKVRTTQDYLDAEEQGLSVEDFLIKD